MALVKLPFDLALRARFGALTPALYDQIHSEQPPPPETRIPIAIWYQEPVDWTSLTPRLASSDAKKQTQAQTVLRKAIAKRSAELTPALRAAGLDDLVVARDLPLLSGNATPGAIQTLGTLVDIKSIELAAPKKTVPLQAFNVTTDAHIDTVFNAPPLSLFGDGFTIGNYGELKSTHMTYQDHESFQFANVVHTDLSAVRTCTDDRDCCDLDDYICPPSGDPPTACVRIAALGGTKRCVVKHTTATASGVSAATEGIPFSAAKAKLLEYNERLTNCIPGYTEAAYSWLLDNGTSTVWESFACSQASIGLADEPVVNDRYARDYGFSIFKAANNDLPAVACRSTLNSICVGGHMDATEIWNEGDGVHGSSWLNRPGSDREEPDVTALGKDANVAWPRDSFGPMNRAIVAGTSIAAPIMATMGLLMKQACAAPNLDPRFVRSVLRTAAWTRNPEGWLYSTPGILAPDGTLYDHKDGGGATMAENVLPFCGAGTNSPPTASGTINVDLVGTPPAPPLVTRTFGVGAPPGGTGKGPPESGGSPPSHAKVPGDLLGARYWSAQLGADKRVRTTWSWDACPVGSLARAAVDFDVYLCNDRPADPSIPAYCYYASRSVDDVNEGFDVRTDAAGLWSLLYVLPAPKVIILRPPLGGPTFEVIEVETCRGSLVEPAAWSVVWFP